MAERAFTIRDHPRALRSVERIRSWAALIAFAVVAGVCVRIGVPEFDAVIRGLLAGIAMFVIAWAAALTVWKQVARAQVEAARERAEQRRQAALQAMEEARQATLERVRDRRVGG